MIRNLLFKIVLATLFCCWFTTLQAGYICAQTAKVFDAMEVYHFKPIENKDTLSNRMEVLFYEIADPLSILLTSEDRKWISENRAGFGNNDCGFYTVLAMKYKARLQSFVTEMNSWDTSLIKEFNTETLKTDLQGKAIISPPLNFEESTRRMKGTLVTYALWSVIESKGQEEIESLTESEFEQEVRTSLMNSIQNFKCYFNHVLHDPLGFDHAFTKILTNCITGSYDPHSAYFDEKTMERWNHMLSKTSSSFGLAFDRNANGNIVISGLKAGSPAWKSNLLHEGDIVKQIKWSNGQTVEIHCENAVQLGMLLDSDFKRTLTIVTIDKNRKEHTLKLTKEAARVDDNTVKSFVLKGDQTVAYLAIPAFYSDWDSDGDRDGVANDVAKELLKVKRQGIDGLILDLRGNGGGSVTEAKDFTGIFINEGPVGRMNGRNGEKETMKDLNRGTAYDGPLVILVDQKSASASEILASALADHNRAIVVGERTFGKGSAQRILPANPKVLLGIGDRSSEINMVKVTQEVLYRVNGESNQGSGFTPHVKLPVYHEQSEKESDYKFALHPEDILDYSFEPSYPPLPTEEIEKRSKSRIQQHAFFNEVQGLKSELRHQQDFDYPLDVSAFLQFAKTHHHELMFFNPEFKPYKALTYQVENNEFDSFLISLSPTLTAINAEIMESIESDAYIEEGFLIISDLIELIQN